MTTTTLTRTSHALLLAAIFTTGNIILPQICHLMPYGGLRWLPIYFFTLIAAYRYGLGIGLVTAIASPLLNSALFGMPPTAMLPIILIKSTLLALTAALIGIRYPKATILTALATVFTYQALGTLAEWALTDSWAVAVSDLTIGIPGIILHIFAAPPIIKRI